MDLDSALNYMAKTFATTYFENKGDTKFVPHPLPDLAQISTVNTIFSSDVDNDGNMDLLLAGNLFGTEVETPRNDARLWASSIGQ